MPHRNKTQDSSPPLLFRTSSYSGAHGDNCVEVAELPSAVAVRDSKRPGRGHLAFPRTEWAALLGALRDGEL